MEKVFTRLVKNEVRAPAFELVDNDIVAFIGPWLVGGDSALNIMG